MPQFELANFVPQIAWLALFFAILFLVIVRPTLPKLDRISADRANHVNADLTAAEAAKATADLTRDGYERAIALAHGDAKAAVLNAKATSAHDLTVRLAGLATDLDAKDTAAQTRISAARESALAELDRVAGDAASAIIERLTGRVPTAGDLASALTAAGRG